MSTSAKGRREYFARRRAELESEIEKTGKLRRQDWWGLQYFKDPYLVEAQTSSLHKRYQDLSGNLVVLYEDGKIGPLSTSDKDRDAWMSRLVHVQEELFARGESPSRADDEIHIPKPTFPEVPPGIRILGGRNLPNSPYLVKIGKHSHMQNMLDGNIRIAPASSYDDKSLIAAIRDNELTLFANYSAGDVDKTTLGRTLAGSVDLSHGGEVIVTRTLPNFYVYCLSYRYDHRLLDDFSADTIVIIKEPKLFLHRLIEAAQKAKPESLFRMGAVAYYDPYYVENWSDAADGFLKHFRYAYQREFRICWNFPQSRGHSFEPFFVNIDDMRSYAEILTLRA